jgi:hypothetical protein
LKKLTLYHGNTEAAIDEIISNGGFLSKFKSVGDKHYLGDGFYFYDDIEQAQVWAIMKVTRNQKYLGYNWSVLQCEVQMEEEQIFDLDKREEQDFFFEGMLRLQQESSMKSIEIENYCDAYLCNHLAKTLDLKLLTKTFVYKDKHRTFPPLFSNNHTKSPYVITRHFRTEKQYVVRDSNFIFPIEKLRVGKVMDKKRGEVR